MVEELSDRELLARLLLAEAGNQGPLGKLAVGAVIRNRAQQGGYGQGLRGVMMRPGQFSPLNSVTGYAGGEQGVDFSRLSPSEQDYLIADMIISGDYRDPTNGATHFYNPSISNPAWGRERSGGEWRAIGAHIFGRADAGSDSAAGEGERLFNAQSARGRAPSEATTDLTLMEQLFGEEGSVAVDEAFNFAADALAGMEFGGGSRRPSWLNETYSPGRQNVGSSALSRMGIASLA